MQHPPYIKELFEKDVLKMSHKEMIALSNYVTENGLNDNLEPAPERTPTKACYWTRIDSHQPCR